MTGIRFLGTTILDSAVVLIAILVFDSSHVYGQNSVRSAGSTHAGENPFSDTVSPDFPRDPDLADYIEYAEKNNPELRSTYLALTAAEKMTAASGVLPDPQLNFVIDDMGTGISAFQQKIELLQMFPWFGKRTLIYEQARIGADMARQTHVQIQLKIRGEVIQAYSEFYYLSRMIAVNEENLTLLVNLERVIRAGYATGENNQSALARVQVEIGMLEEELQTLADMTETARAKLNTVLGLSSEYPQPFPGDLPDVRISLSMDSLNVLLQKNNPAIESIRLKTLINMNDVKLAEKQFYPDFMVGVGTERLMNKPMNGNRNSVMGMFSVTIPVWRSSYANVLRAAQSGEQSTRQELENEINASVTELKEIMFRYRDAQRKITLYRDSLIPKTRELLSLSQRAYEAGNADFLDIIDSQRTLIDLELGYERALTDRIQAVSQLESMIDVTLISGE
jgi:outer membrane protein, heavy metal efflux system